MKWKNEFSRDVLDKSKDYVESINEVKIVDRQINVNLKKSAVTTSESFLDAKLYSFSYASVIIKSSESMK